MCSATLTRLDPLEEVNFAPAGMRPVYSSVPAHMVWNHRRDLASARRSGLGQPKITVARASSSSVTALPLV